MARRAPPRRESKTPRPVPEGGLRPADRVAMGSKRRWRELLRAPPALILALLVHLGLLLTARELLFNGDALPEDDGRSVSAQLEPEAERFVPEPPPPPPELEPPPPLDDVDAAEAPAVASADPLDAPPTLTSLGLGARGLGGGGGGGGARAGAGGAELPLGIAADDAFADFVGDLRKRGLDVVFVVDATGSMQRFLDRAREVLDDIATDLESVVPSLRLGFVAYRDLADDWVTLHAPLDADRYRVANVLLDLRASGGRRKSADLPEAVEEGLRVAVEELDWRKGARRVILLVGDAPYHAEDRSAALGQVRSFARDPQSVVNTLHIRSGGGAVTSNELATAEAFGRIVQSGGGVAFEWDPEDAAAGDRLRSQVREATFGREWMDEIEALLKARGPDPRAAVVRRHLTRKDRRWFARRLLDETLHPLVVKGCAALLDRSLGQACLARLAAPSALPGLRSAVLYALKTAIPELRGMSVEIEQPLDRSSEIYRRIERAVGKLPLAPPGQRAQAEAGVVKPPPAPPPR